MATPTLILLLVELLTKYQKIFYSSHTSLLSLILVFHTASISYNNQARAAAAATIPNKAPKCLF